MGLLDSWFAKAEKFVHGWRIFDRDKAQKLEGNIEDIATKAVTIANDIKDWVNNPIEDFIIQMLPKWAQDTEGKLQTYLPVILGSLLSIKDPLAMEAQLKNVKLANNFYWDKFFHDLAVSIAQVLSNGSIDFADIAVAIQFVKDHIGKTE